MGTKIKLQKELGEIRFVKKLQEDGVTPCPPRPIIVLVKPCGRPVLGRREHSMHICIRQGFFFERPPQAVLELWTMLLEWAQDTTRIKCEVLEGSVSTLGTTQRDLPTLACLVHSPHPPPSIHQTILRPAPRPAIGLPPQPGGPPTAMLELPEEGGRPPEGHRARPRRLLPPPAEGLYPDQSGCLPLLT